MPLTSVVAAASMAILGPSYVAGTVPLVVLSPPLLPLLTYLVADELWGIAGRPSWASGVLAIFAGPLLIMYPTTDNSAVFGACGAASLYCSMRCRARPSPCAVAGGGRRVRGVGDACANRRCPANPWQLRLPGSCVEDGRHGVHRRPAQPRSPRAAASAAAFLLVLAPWIGRNMMRLSGARSLSTRGHTALDHVVQRAVLDRPRGEHRDLPRLGAREYRGLEARVVVGDHRTHRGVAGRDVLRVLPRRRLAVPAARRAGAISRVLRGDVRGHGSDLHVPRAEGCLLSLLAGVAALGHCGFGCRASRRLPRLPGGGGVSCVDRPPTGFSSGQAWRVPSCCRWWAPRSSIANGTDLGSATSRWRTSSGGTRYLAM